MNLSYRKIFCLLLLTTGLSGITLGQFTSQSADKLINTAYSQKDKIFAFYQTPVAKLGSLTASVPDTGKANIQWTKYDTTSRTFKLPFKNDVNVHNSRIDTLTEGAYMVHITRVSPKLDTTFTAWIVFNSLTIAVDKDNNGFVPYFRSTCDYFDLITNFTYKPLKKYRYFNPDSAKAKPYEFTNIIRLQWQVSATGAVVSNTTLNRTRIAGKDMPPENTDYSVQVTDTFGLTQTDHITYKSIVTRADFELKTDDPVDGKNSAPYHVEFTNNSKNGYNFTWYLGDGDTIKTQDLAPFKHIYYLPDSTVSIKLISESKDECIDTLSKNFAVAPPQIEWPNVFVPRNGETFKFIHSVSLHYYRFIIFTRLGKKIYEETAFDKPVPDGWDGKIGSSLASEGVYFYTLEVMHWDPHPKQVNAKGRYSGCFYLFHPN
jgi:hypothetical protein